jgi:FKBP-type peptidyl-prolyl cis-trans isomerase FklB
LKHQNLDLESFKTGLEAVYSDNEIQSTRGEVSQSFNMFLANSKNMQHEENKLAGEDYLTKNGERDGVSTTSSGLQYEIITPGNGPKPTLSDKVKVHYHGTTIDGTVFDSSVNRGEPISFPLNGVILGWQEGVALMPVGSKYRLFIPQDLAYGARGAGDVIPPFSALIFDVELLAIE